jgi:glycosyltransferase involved in cell wall biosynthesis
MQIGLVTRSQVDYALDLANELNEEGLSVTLYMSEAFAAQEIGTSDRPVECLYEVGMVPYECKVRLLRLPRMRNLRSLALFRKLSRTMHDDGVDLVHILLNPEEIWFAILACLLHDLPVVTTMIVPSANVGEHLPAFVTWAIHKLAVYGSDIVVVNGADQVELVQRLYGVPPDRIAYVPLSLHARTVKWRTETVAEEPGTILFFGAARRRKGLEYLVRAQTLITRQVPHARILISAHGEDLDRCRQMIVDDDAFEIHEGFVPGDVMAAFFQRASLVALPYLSASTSGILMTAFTFGKPVVATRVGCLPEYVEEGVTGLLVAPADIEQMATAIVRLLSSDALRHRMGVNAARWVEERQSEIIVQTLNAYEKAIRVHRDGSGHNRCRMHWKGFIRTRSG